MRKIGKAKLAVTMDHAAMPLTADELLDLGVGYSHVAPAPSAVLLRSMRERVQSIHKAVEIDISVAPRQ